MSLLVSDECDQVWPVVGSEALPEPELHLSWRRGSTCRGRRRRRRPAVQRTHRPCNDLFHNFINNSLNGNSSDSFWTFRTYMIKMYPPTKGVPTLPLPIFFWKSQDLMIVVWIDTQTRKLLPECIFFNFKNSVGNWTNIVKTRKTVDSLKTDGNIAISPTLQPWALLLYVLQGMIIGFKFFRNNLCSKLDAIFKVRKMNCGSKLGAWVSFHTAILQSWKF